jgi:DNA-binding FadR family transcriptional regulator
VRIRTWLDAKAGYPEWRLPAERHRVAETSTGRRAVRRALQQLEVEGRVWRRQGKGTFAGQRSDVGPQLVASLADRTSPPEVMEARRKIEPGLARHAAAKIFPEGVETLKRLLRRLSASEEAEAMEQHDGAEAERAMRQHLMTLQSNLRQALLGLLPDGMVQPQQNALSYPNP